MGGFFLIRFCFHPTNLPMSTQDIVNTEDNGGEAPPTNLPFLREQDRFLPIANINRIMKLSLPKDGKIAKDAKENIQECVSEFISFITSEASEKCLQEKRKTINGDDILCAMQTLGFDPYHEPLKVYLQNYRAHNDKTQPPQAKKDTPNQSGDAIMYTNHNLMSQSFDAKVCI